MKHLTRAQLAAAKYDLRRADAALARVRGLLIAGGAAQDAASVATLIDRIAILINRIDAALLAKP